MRANSRCSNLALLAVAVVFEAASFGLTVQAAAPDDVAPQQPRSPARLAVIAKPQLDRSGKRRIGKASFYARMFEGRKMADGKRMDPQVNNAASRTLPLGTTAKVTNLKTGKSAVVVIQDRGPYVDGRIVDLSPATAQEIGLSKRQGVAKVEVAPITVPQADGRVKFGDAAGDAQLASNERAN
ncbi:MAG TPA: septal ring lytic transglycosylase RlpA family protein [Steroidobacteraceae bacterium]